MMVTESHPGPPCHSTTSMFITATAHSPVLPHIGANTDAGFVLLMPHHKPLSSQSATHRELNPWALLLISFFLTLPTYLVLPCLTWL